MCMTAKTRCSTLGRAGGRTQIVQFGMPSGDRLGNQVAEHIGGSAGVLLRVVTTFGDMDARELWCRHCSVTPPGCLGGEDGAATIRALLHADRFWLASPDSTIQGMAFDELPADRVRARLQHDARVSERMMFGGLAFLTGGHLTVGVYGDGLIARIGAQDMDAATAQSGVRPFDMTGRPMRGIVVIDSSMLDDQALDRWIGQARGYVAGLPPK